MLVILHQTSSPASEMVLKILSKKASKSPVLERIATFNTWPCLVLFSIYRDLHKILTNSQKEEWGQIFTRIISLEISSGKIQENEMDRKKLRLIWGLIDLKVYG